MNFAIPGFQTPSDAPKAADRVLSHADGTIEFPFVTDRPLDEVMPPYVVYISAERGREINLQAFSTETKFIYEQRDDITPTKSYWFRLRPEEVKIYPGTFKIRFVLDGQEVASRSATVQYTPAAPRPFDTAIFPWPVRLD